MWDVCSRRVSCLEQVRYYSISSSPKAYASSVHITAVLVRNDELPAGRVFVGVATGICFEISISSARFTPMSSAFVQVVAKGCLQRPKSLRRYVWRAKASFGQ